MTDGSFWTAYLVKLAITAVVLAALYLAGRRLRAMRPFSGRGRCLTVVETTALSPHAALHVVEIGSRRFLLGSAAGGISSLAELTEAESEARR